LRQYVNSNRLNMKKSLLIITACVPCAGLYTSAHAESSAQEVKPVIIINAADEKSTLPIDQVQQITFEGKDMVLLHNDGTLRKCIDDIEDIKFDFASSAVESVSKEFDDDFAVSFENGIMTVRPAEGKSVDLSIFDLQGVEAKAAHFSVSQTFDLNTLQKGVYIIIINNKTIKFTR